MEIQFSTEQDVTYPKIEVFGALPRAIETELLAALKKVQEPLLNTIRLQETRRVIHSRQIPRYEVDWASFSYLYYGANFAKSYIVARTAGMPCNKKPIQIVDLGCGGGASTVGIVSAIKKSFSEGEAGIEKITVVDRSPHQLALFDKVARPWIRREFPDIGLEIRQDDIFDFLNDTAWSADLVILSYITCELSEHENKLLRSILRKRFSDQSTQVWIIETDAMKRGVSVELLNGRSFTVPYDQVCLRFRYLESLNLPVRPKFSHGANTDLLHRYFDAWIAHDTDAIRQIFSTAATYDIVGRRTLYGIDEIADYWDRNKLNQRNVECGTDRVIATKDGLTAVWWARFERVDHGEFRQLRGMLSITIDKGRIASLTEAYTQTRTSLEKQNGNA